MTKEDVNVYSNRISNANPTQLIVIMYDMAMDYLKSSVRYLNEGSRTEFCYELKKAKRVINNLAGILDMKYKVAEELLDIYIFINNAIVRAYSRYDTSEISRCIAMLEKLRESFNEISSLDNSGKVMENAQQVYAGLTYSRNSLNETMSQDYNRGFTV